MAFLFFLSPSANKTRPPRQFSLMPGIPNQTDKPVLNLKTLKDFIKLNAVSNMMAIASSLSLSLFPEATVSIH